MVTLLYLEGLSHVPAFFRDLERYLTLEVRSQGISVLFAEGLGHVDAGKRICLRCWGKKKDTWQEKTEGKIWGGRRNVLSTGARAATGGTSI